MKPDKTLAVQTFQQLLDDMCRQAEADLTATRARLEAFRQEREPPG